MVQLCLPQAESGKDKFSFYYIIMCLSVACLAATIIIYLVFRSALLRSDYNKIMLNFSGSLLMAFLVLAVIQVHGNDIYTFSGLCLILGHCNVFFFLASFTWMTIMSYFIFDQIHGMNHVVGGRGNKYLAKVMLIGYGVPALIVIAMIIIELAVDKCSAIHPGFGNRSCLFYNDLSKFLWFLGPILIMLLINTGMFVYILFNVIKTQNMSAALKSGKRKEKLDRICLYLRLFVGMGIIWYFEILAFFIDDDADHKWLYLGDVLNMLQGVWVFLTFVCKRNVLQVVTKKRDALYSVVKNKVKQTSIGSGQNRDTSFIRFNNSQQHQSNLSVQPTAANPTDQNPNRSSMKTEMFSMSSMG